jgi:hypothetical protein
MGFNSVFKGLKSYLISLLLVFSSALRSLRPI